MIGDYLNANLFKRLLKGERLLIKISSIRPSLIELQKKLKIKESDIVIIAYEVDLVKIGGNMNLYANGKKISNLLDQGSD